MKHLLLILSFFVSIHTCVIAQHKQDIESLVEMGNDLVKLNDYKGALDKYDEALVMLPSYTQAIDGKANVLILLLDYKSASKIIEEGIKNNPDYAPYYLTRGKINIFKEKFENAIEDLNLAFDLNKSTNNKELENMVYVNRGAAYQKLFEKDKALADYSKAIEQNPDNPNVYMYRGFLYYQNNEFTEAIEDFNTVLDIDEQNPYAYYNRGMTYIKMEDNDKACQDFHKACQLGNYNACKMIVSRCMNKKK
ncbi:MAG: hypothetical protein A2W99_02785 [Bacteroidetes bacterium GWF2_33_16]|nr:MAG: hypothetical protein A2X00_10230 [Bacteroidetes bacterium GWE2_32_14]OFY07823.1 MAG: hypothetical protein A2W99_02785 [Bacteroidetes bacterium GWF2_33_16]